MPNVVSVDFLLEAYWCKYFVAKPPNSKVLTSSTGSSYASIEGYCGNCIAFNDVGRAFSALVVAIVFSFIEPSSFAIPD